MVYHDKIMLNYEFNKTVNSYYKKVLIYKGWPGAT